LLVDSCSPLSGSTPAPSAIDDNGVSLADHDGPTLVILSLSPGALGENKVQVRLRDPVGKRIDGSARVSLRRGNVEIAAVGVTANVGEGKLLVSEADNYELLVAAVPVGQFAGVVRFELALPAPFPGPDLLARVDRAMNQLQGFRETQTLTSGTFVYAFSFAHEAPDRTGYSFIGPDGGRHETVLIGTRRFDRDGQGPWSESDLGIPVATASFRYSADPNRVRLIGHESVDGRDTLVIALVAGAAPGELYYRLWIDAATTQVQRYTMMATGHYMGGSYSDFNAPVDIAPPKP